MPKLATTEYLLKALEQWPDGAHVDELSRALYAAPPKRTLQRHLAMLAKEGRILTEGKARATRYRVPGAVPEIPWVAAEPAAFASTPDSIPLSPESDHLRSLVRAPQTERRPVGYHRGFLEEYRPNKTYYLTQEQRHGLLELGRVDPTPRPAGTHARTIFDRMLIDLSWNSSRLEGNTYSLLDTERLLKEGVAASGKELSEMQMIVNHKSAIEFLVQNTDEIAFNRYTILNLHAILAEDLLPRPQGEGRLRTGAMGMGGSVFNPLSAPGQIEECFNLLLSKATAITDPFEAAFFSMVHLPYLQPFEDVNKRVSRFAANIPLITFNLSPVSFVDVPQTAYLEAVLAVQEHRRVDYLRDVFLWAYQRSAWRYAALRNVVGDPDPFRVRHRVLLKSLVQRVLEEAQNREQAIASIDEAAKTLNTDTERRRFIEMANNELVGIHEGNFAKYRVRPSEFDAWRRRWSANENPGTSG